MSHDVWMNAWGDHVIFFLFLYYAIIVDLFQVRNVLTLKHLSDKVLRRNEKNFVIVIIIYIFFIFELIDISFTCLFCLV